MSYAHMSSRQFVISLAIMASIVIGSNILVQYPINHWLTWGALSYPVSFLVTDLLNRRFGPTAARRIVYIGFAAAVLISIGLATPRIALASGTAFLLAQLTDITVFDRLRHQHWWRAPFIGGAAGATLDTVVFFFIAFVGTGVHWQALIVGDLAVKLAVNLFMLAPFRALMWNLARPEGSPREAR
ncbi:MAG TPA: VUT family protein [Castellaniella sp.]|nr:VUT family protein [Castellaniella sp.]